MTVSRRRFLVVDRYCVVEIAQDRRRIGLRPRPGVMRAPPSLPLALVATGAGLRAHMARYGPTGLGHAGGRAEDKKTRYCQETEKKNHHVPSRGLRGGSARSAVGAAMKTFSLQAHRPIPSNQRTIANLCLPPSETNPG